MVNGSALPGQGRSDEPEWMVWLTVGVALVCGIVLAAMVQGRTAVASVPGASFLYGGTWTQVREPDTLFAAADLKRGDLSSGPRLAVRHWPASEAPQRDPGIVDVANAWALTRANDLLIFRILGVTPTRVAGRDAAQLEYAYVDTSGRGSVSGAVPRVVRAIDTIVSGTGGYVIVTVSDSAELFQRVIEPQFPRLSSDLDVIIQSLQVS